MKKHRVCHNAALLYSYNLLFGRYAFNRGLHYKDALQVSAALLESRFRSMADGVPPETRRLMSQIAVTAASGYDPRFTITPLQPANTNH